MEWVVRTMARPLFVLAIIDQMWRLEKTISFVAINSRK